MRAAHKYALYLLLGFLLLVVALDVWGYLTLGSLFGGPRPAPINENRNETA